MITDYDCMVCGKRFAAFAIDPFHPIDQPFSPDEAPHLHLAYGKERLFTIGPICSMCASSAFRQLRFAIGVGG